jgi:hypothetical protein
MNRTVIIVKNPLRGCKEKFSLITLHWQHGPLIENWLNASCPHLRAAWDLIEAGHRSTIFEQHRLVREGAEHYAFRTLREAKAYCEYLTLAYYDGKRWRFEHEPQGV